VTARIDATSNTATTPVFGSRKRQVSLNAVACRWG
jgi:hypothetical protein